MVNVLVADRRSWRMGGCVRVVQKVTGTSGAKRADAVILARRSARRKWESDGRTVVADSPRRIDTLVGDLPGPTSGRRGANRGRASARRTDHRGGVRIPRGRGPVTRL